MIMKTSLRNRIRPFEDIKRLAQDQEILVSLKIEGTKLSTDNSNSSDEDLTQTDHQRSEKPEMQNGVT